MAVFKTGTAIQGVLLTDILAGATANGRGLSQEEWTAIQDHVRNGGARIIKLRGRSSYQSPSHQSVEMLRGRIQGGYEWPCGVFFGDGPYAGVMMAADVDFTDDGLVGKVPHGLPEDEAALKESYEHIVKLRDQVIDMGVLPPVDQWKTVNPNL
jgi:malate dehydrogenase